MTKRAVGQHHVHVEQVVDGEAAGAREVADAAAEGEAADAGGGDDAAGGRQAEGVGGVVDVAPGAAALDAHGAVRRIDADALHRDEVDHQAVVADAEAGAVVPAAADGDEEAVLAGEVDGGDHVGDVRAAGDQRGLAVDHRVVDLAGGVVARVVRADKGTPEARTQRLERRLVDACVGINRHGFIPPCVQAHTTAPA